MKLQSRYLIISLLTMIAGCSVQAQNEPRKSADPGEIHINKDAVRALLTPFRQISVVGSAQESVVPDIADISVGVTVARPTPAEAVAINNRTMTALIAAIKTRGVAAKDIQTSQISISPQYSQATEGRPDAAPQPTGFKVVGYEVGNTLRITMRDLSRIGDILDAAVKAGANQVYGVAFRITDREAVMTGLRVKAFESARRKANAYAKEEENAGWGSGPTDPEDPRKPTRDGPLRNLPLVSRRHRHRLLKHHQCR